MGAMFVKHFLDEKQSVCKIALLSKDIIDLAERGNDVALSIIQEATAVLNLEISFRKQKNIYRARGISLQKTLGEFPYSKTIG